MEGLSSAGVQDIADSAIFILTVNHHSNLLDIIERNGHLLCCARDPPKNRVK